MPMKQMWSMHWFTSRTQEGFAFWDPTSEEVSFGEYVLMTVPYFLFQQAFWILFNFVIKAEKLKTQNYENSFTHFAVGKGKIAEYARKIGETKARMLYTGSAFAYFIVTTCISYIFYRSFILNTVWLVTLTVIAAKNGASYYFGYFA